MNVFRVWCHKRNEWEKCNIVLTQQGKLFDLDKRKNLNLDAHIIEFGTGLTDKNGVKIFDGDRVEIISEDVKSIS